MVTTLEIGKYDELKLLSMADAAAAILEDEAVQLSDLVRVVSTDIMDGFVDPSTMRRILVGSALMRTLNTTAQMRLYGEDPNFTA